MVHIFFLQKTLDLQIDKGGTSILFSVVLDHASAPSAVFGGPAHSILHLLVTVNLQLKKLAVVGTAQSVTLEGFDTPITPVI